jgi:intracellular septation protein
MFLGILFFGGITIILHDPFYLKIKVSIIFFIISLVLFFSFYLGKKQPLVKTIALKTGENFSKVPESNWRLINWLWIGFYLSIAILNLYVAFNFSLDTWVSFKVWGITLVNFVLLIISLFIIFPYLDEEADSQSGE